MLPHERFRFVSEREIARLLSSGPVQFVVANVGDMPYWVAAGQRLAFWKTEVLPHLVADPAEGFLLEDFPGEYAYVASEWRHPDPEADLSPVVLLETHH